MSDNVTIGSIKASLDLVFESVSLRGEGRACFLFVQHLGRAVELSEHREGGWWLEFWEADEADTAPVKEMICTTDEDALRAISGWCINQS